jgi:hypothetical protein
VKEAERALSHKVLNRLLPQGLTNASGGVIQVNPGTGGSRSFTGSGTLDNQGQINVAGNASLAFTNGTYQADGGTIGGIGNAVISGSKVRVSVMPAGGMTLTLLGTCTLLGDNPAGSTLLVQGPVPLSPAVLNVAAGAANLTLDGPGAQVINTSNLTANPFANFATNTDSLTLRNGRNLGVGAFTNSGTLTVGAGSTFTASGYTQTGGNTNLIGGTLAATSVTIGAGSSLAGPGAITGNVTNSGQINPGGTGTGGGTLSITGNFTQTGTGSLNLRIGGTAPSQVDKLAISGAATLAGTLNVAIVNGYVPQAGDAIQILTFASVTGDFTTQNLQGFTKVFDTTTTPKSLSLKWPAS